MLDFALRYAAAGLKVFPLRARSKLPLTLHGSHESTTDETKIREWWGRWPEANIGMTLGGLVVIDIDPRNGGELHALPHVLPDTCCAYTGGGGSHFLFRARDGVRYQGKLAQGIDVKSGPGAYIVVEPSIHESGQKYSWIDESEPWAQKPALAPEWLGQVSKTPKTGIAGDVIKAGSRNEELTSRAGAMRRKGMCVEAIEAALFVENKRCVPPLDGDEIRKIAASVGRYAPEEHADTDIPDVIAASDVLHEIEEVHEKGLGKGDLPGWPSVDELFTVAPGQLTTITGYPNSGKSQWLDAVALNLARQGWRVVFCSLENIPVFLHVEKLAKQLVGKPMRLGPTERMSIDELKDAVKKLAEWFRFVMPSAKKPNPSLPEVMSAIEEEFKRQGLERGAKRACVIDPWNELEHVRPSGVSLTEHIGSSLSILRQWARQNLIHVFLVGHPAKQYRNRETAKLPVATPDMISDSAHFWNKSDICITVALTDEHKSAEVDIYVQKMRFSHIGKRGAATLVFDRMTGRYHEKSNVMDFRVRSGKDF